MEIFGYSPNKLIELVQKGICLLVERCGIEKDCGYFTVFDTTAEGEVVLICRIGVCPSGKAKKYFVFSQEKAQRLFSSPSHKTSFQSRDPENDKWGGAIRSTLPSTPLVTSFSGLPELADEALMTFVAYQAGWIDKPTTAIIADISNNPYIGNII